MSNYNSTHTGAELDEAISAVLEGGTLSSQVATNTSDISDLKDSVGNVQQVTEDGFFVVDEALNVGFKVNADATAKNVTYDNTASGLTATNVNDAIDEVAQSSGVINSLDRTVDTSTTNPIERIHYRAGLAAIFRTWGFIGDSLASGEVEYTSGGSTRYEDMYEYSWGQHICRLCGSEGYNYSQSGETALRWTSMTGNRRWPQLKADGAKQAYIVALGANEAASGNISTDIGTYNPTTDTDTNANTFVGHYAGVLQRIRSLNANSVIFCVTLPQDNHYYSAQKNALIRGVAETFSNCYIIDLDTYGVSFRSADIRSLYFMGTHMTGAGYLYTAYVFMNYIDWIIRQNPAAFQRIQVWDR